MTLVSPSGTTIDQNTTDPDVTHTLGPTFESYSIIDPEPGDWTINLFGEDVPPEGEEVAVTVTLIQANTPPVAEPGPDQMVEATSLADTSVTLNGAASSDPDGEALSFEWRDDATNQVVGAIPQLNLTLPLGTHSFTLTVNDGRGGTASDTVMVTVEDTTPPLISLTDPGSQNGCDLTVTFDATDSASGVATVLATLNGDVVSNRQPVTLTNSASATCWAASAARISRRSTVSPRCSPS